MKKFLKKNIIIKMVAIVLVAATVMGIAWNESFVKTKASGKVRTENVVTRGEEDDEEEYNFTDEEIESMDTVELSDGRVETTIITVNGLKVVSIADDEKVFVTIYDANNNILQEKVYDYSGEEDIDYSDVINNESEENDDTNLTDISNDDFEEDSDYVDEYEDADDITRSGHAKWSKEFREQYKGKMWYRRGTKEYPHKTAHYIRFGLKATYQIRYDHWDLNDANQKYKLDQINKFVNNILKCNEKMKTAKGILRAAGIAVGIIATIFSLAMALQAVGKLSVKGLITKIGENKLTKPIIAAIGLPSLTAILTKFIGTFNGAEAAYTKAYDTYLVIRTYGAKL